MFIVLSDLHDRQSQCAAARRARHEVVVLHLRDPAENRVSGAGFLHAREAETGAGFLSRGQCVDPSDERWPVNWRGGVDHLLLRADRPIAAPLREFLRARNVLGRGPDEFSPGPLLGTFGLALFLCAAHGTAAGATGVGMTSELKDVLLPGSELRPKPDPSGRSPVVVRVTAVYPHGTAGFRYDFSWFAYEAGKHDLAKFLERVDGTRAGALPPVEVEATAALPDGPPGHLAEFSAPVPRLGGYRTLLIMGSVLWLAGFVALICWRRGKRSRRTGRRKVPCLWSIDSVRSSIARARDRWMQTVGPGSKGCSSGSGAKSSN